MTTNDNEGFLFIPLSRGYVAKVSLIDKDLTESIDPLDATRKKSIKYSVVQSGKNYYAVCSKPGDNKTKEYLARRIKEKELGRSLLKTEKVIFVDGRIIDNVLDYTRANLQIKTANNPKVMKT